MNQKEQSGNLNISNNKNQEKVRKKQIKTNLKLFLSNNLISEIKKIITILKMFVKNKKNIILRNY